MFKSKLVHQQMQANWLPPHRVNDNGDHFSQTVALGSSDSRQSTVSKY